MDKICIRMYGKQEYEKILCIAPEGRHQYGVISFNKSSNSWTLQKWGGGHLKGFESQSLSDKCIIK